MLDDFGILDRLQQAGVNVVLNTGHDYMVRYEMKRKRAAFSKRLGLLCAVWNRGCKKANESRVPWMVIREGVDKTKEVKELEQPVPGQPGVRIGMLDR